MIYLESESEKPKEKPSTLLLFDTYDLPSTEMLDKGMASAIKSKSFYMPYTFGRHAHKRFRKLDLNLVERMANLISSTKKAGGKKAKGIVVLKKVLHIIADETKENPTTVLLNAVQNAAPREDTTKISYGGVAYFQSVDISPSRRIDLAIRNIIHGARQKSHKNPLGLERALVEEIKMTAKNDSKSYSISKKEELERHAEASR